MSSLSLWLLELQPTGECQIIDARCDEQLTYEGKDCGNYQCLLESTTIETACDSHPGQEDISHMPVNSREVSVLEQEVSYDKTISLSNDGSTYRVAGAHMRQHCISVRVDRPSEQRITR